jgi:ectoine hydrolase
MDMLGGRRTCWMADEFILGYADHFVQSTERHPMQDLALRIKELGFEGARIGVEMENYYYSAKAHAVLWPNCPARSLLTPRHW